MKLNSLVDLTTFRPLRWAAPRCHLDVTGRMPPRVPANCQAWLDPSSLRSAVRCVLLSVSINLQQGNPRLSGALQHSVTKQTLCAYSLHMHTIPKCACKVSVTHTHRNPFNTPACSTFLIMSTNRLKQFADNTYLLLIETIDNNYVWGKKN